MSHPFILRRSGAAVPALLLVCGMLILSCGQEAGNPTEPAGTLTSAAQPSIPSSIQAQINALFQGGHRNAVTAQVRNILRQAGKGQTADAQNKFNNFVSFSLKRYELGQLSDPNGPTNDPTIEAALAELFAAVAGAAGLPAPPITEQTLLDGAVGFIGPAGGTLVANTGFAGLDVEQGTLTQTVMFTITRLPDPVVVGEGPLPTTLDQYPLFYDISMSPEVELLKDVIVGVCVVDPPDPFAPPPSIVAQLRLAHPDPDNPSVIEILPLEAAPFLSCAGASTNTPPPVFGISGGRALTPASPGELGGRVSAFSPFGAVDPESGEPEPEPTPTATELSPDDANLFTNGDNEGDTQTFTADVYELPEGPSVTSGTVRFTILSGETVEYTDDKVIGSADEDLDVACFVDFAEYSDYVLPQGDFTIEAEFLGTGTHGASEEPVPSTVSCSNFAAFD